MAELINAQLERYDARLFEGDQDAIDSTAYRVSSIGEAALHLSTELKGRHPEIDWAAIAGMRNILAHDYDGVLPSLLWRVYVTGLSPLTAVALEELVS